jgi:hypothetical protein
MDEDEDNVMNQARFTIQVTDRVNRVERERA